MSQSPSSLAEKFWTKSEMWKTSEMVITDAASHGGYSATISFYDNYNCNDLKHFSQFLKGKGFSASVFCSHIDSKKTVTIGWT